MSIGPSNPVATTPGNGTDTYAILNGNYITFPEGNILDVTNVLNPDTDDFATLSGTKITFPGGDTISIDSDTKATISGNIITFADGQTRDITPVVDTDTDTFATLSGGVITFPNGDTLTIPNATHLAERKDFNATIIFDKNYYTSGDKLHDQTGEINFVGDLTNAVIGYETVIEIQSNGQDFIFGANFNFVETALRVSNFRVTPNFNLIYRIRMQYNGDKIDLTIQEIGVLDPPTTLFDNFSSSQLDFSKWTLVGGFGLISQQNNRLEFNLNHGGSIIMANSFQHGLKTNLGFTTGFVAFQFEIEYENVARDQGYVDCRLWQRDSLEGFSFSCAKILNHFDAGEITLQIWDDGSRVYNLTGIIPTSNKFKIDCNIATNDVRFWNWNGAIWVQLGTTQNVDLLKGIDELIGAFSVNDSPSATAIDYAYVKNVYLTDTDYVTENPQ